MNHYNVRQMSMNKTMLVLVVANQISMMYFVLEVVSNYYFS